MLRFHVPGEGVALVLAAILIAGCAREQPPRPTPEAAIEQGPGRVRPLSEVLALARRIAPGKVIDVELESDVGIDDGGRGPRWVYEIEVLTEDNRVIELEVDATTGQLLEIDGAPWPADIPQVRP